MAAPSFQQPGFRFVHHLLRARDYQDRPEFDRLAEWWRSTAAGGAGVCALTGIGGAGKTAIVERFLRLLPGVLPEHPDLPKDGTLPTPQGLFVFSFYQVPNPDEFFGQLAAWLKGKSYDESAPTPSYGQTLALLQQAGPCLLVLDGLEKVQDDGLRGGIFGQITDGRLRDLVLLIADGWLCNCAVIITTRFRPFDPLHQRSQFYLAIHIERLGEETAVALLRARGVTRGTDDQLKWIARDQHYHALSVDLMGGYIARFCNGDPGKLPPEPAIAADTKAEPAGVVDPQVAAVRDQERKFARVAERYREGLADKDPAALALLQRVCLFRLGVNAETLASIFTGAEKEGISGPHLACLSLEQV